MYDGKVYESITRWREKNYINPRDWYNGKSKTFKRNKRKGK